MILPSKKARLIAGLFFFSSSFLSASSQKILQKRLESFKLWENKEWKRLIHDEDSLFGEQSEADSSDFFLTSNGATQYKKEIMALLEESMNLSSVDDQHAICRFPARTKWLYKKLELDPKNIPFQRCQGYSNFLNLVESDESSMVFSSYYLESPASAFGHTLLKLKRKKGPFYQNTDLLDMGINFSAQVTTNNAALYALFGLIGAFKGTYSAIPYYYKVREYNDHESRDLWTYELNLTSEQHQRMLDHLWEVGNTYFYYYYFTENCSYNLITLLEVANFDLELKKELPSFYTIPSHTIRLIMKAPGLVKKFHATPSLRKRFDAHFNKLSPQEKKIVLNAYQNKSIDEIKSQEKNKTFLIDVLSLYIDYLHSSEILFSKGDISQWKNEILIYRSELGENEIQTTKIVNDKEAPHLGHGPRRLSLGSRLIDHSKEPRYSTLLEYRFALHSFMDYWIGQPDMATLEFFDIAIEHLGKNFILNKLDIIDVMALNPINEYKHPFSLKAKFGWLKGERRCQNCAVFSSHLAGGLSFRKKDNIFYSFIGIKTETSKQINPFTGFAFIPEVGIKVMNSDQFALQIRFYEEILLENGENRPQIIFDFNYYPRDDHRIRLEYSQFERKFSQIDLKYYFYF